MQFNAYSLFEKFWSKDYRVEPTLSFLKILNKWEYSSTDFVFLQNFDQKIIQFNPDSLQRKFWTKENAVKPLVSFSKFLTKKQSGSTHRVFQENVH